MKIKRIIAFIITLSVMPLYALASPSSSDVRDEIPYVKHDSQISAYTFNKMEVYTESDAPDSVPSGFTGYVMKLTGTNSSSGITVDFSDREIPMSIIKSLRMRVYYPSVTKEVRITTEV